MSGLTVLSKLRSERGRCPFYSFSHGMVMDSNGNQCPFILSGYSPCQMEMAGQKPDWDKCHLNTPEIRSAMSDAVARGMKVRPRELNPRDGMPWEGILLSDWIALVME